MMTHGLCCVVVIVVVAVVAVVVVVVCVSVCVCGCVCGGACCSQPGSAFLVLLSCLISPLVLF